MKRISFILAILVLSFGLANAQSVVLTSVNEFGSDTLGTGPCNFEFTWDNTGAPAPLSGFTNGFAFSLTGGTRDAVQVDSLFYDDAVRNCGNFDSGGKINKFSWDGLGTDTIGLGGFYMSDVGMAVGATCLMAKFSVNINADADGETFCIDSAWYPPGGDWLWSFDAGTADCGWAGPFCWLMYEVPNQAPIFTDCPATTQIFDHIALATVIVVAEDRDTIPSLGKEAFYTMVSGPGNVDFNSGVWSYQPTLCDPNMTVEIAAEDGLGMTAAVDNCIFDVQFTNSAPAFDAGVCGVTTKVGMGNTAFYCLSFTDADGDPAWAFIDGVAPIPVGGYSIASATGCITFNTATGLAPLGDGGITYTFTVGITDGCDTVLCDAFVEVMETDPFELQIEKTHATLQGMHEYVDVTVNKGSELMGGFDILIAYDPSAIGFQTVLEGDLYGPAPACGWEYFVYRYGPFGNCGNGCPSGQVRVVGMAETNNGPYHPTCFTTTMPFVLFTLDFLVTDDRTFECQYVPIRFYWYDCGDNTISSKYGDTLFISDRVFDFDLIGEITDNNYAWGYPTFTGAQDSDCFGPNPLKVPVRFIDFYNGGIDIVCADSIDARGDINLNEIPNEIADAVLYSNYFVYGLTVFNVNMPGQVAASDVNADGITLSVADLVYLIRVVIGDAVPYAKLASITTDVVYDNVLDVDFQAGAARVVIAGNAVPELLADNMELVYNFDGTNTNALVWSVDGNSFTGEFLIANGTVVDVELATAEGAAVNAKGIIPGYTLNQNYPNPFNPTTTIAFNLDEASNYTLTIFNVAGQEVVALSGVGSQGDNTRMVDLSGQASGIYFYKLEAGDFSATKKMVLLK